jgi:hypothetical protein
MAAKGKIDALREQLAKALAWSDAHVDFDGAVRGLPERLRGIRPKGLPYSAWQLVEHIRLAQSDILDFCRNPKYRAQNWPDDYWPARPAPPTRSAWSRSLAAFRADRRELQRLARNPRLDLFAKIPHGDGQTYLREILLAADHTAYHVGELVMLRRLLGAWK